MARNGNHPEISLIFVNYRSARVLSRALRSVSSDLDSGFAEVVIVNNDSGEEKSVRELCDRFGCRSVRMSGNAGFGAASNRGTELANTDVVGFVNPDAELVNGSLRDIVEIFRSDRKVGVVGAALIDSSGNPEKWSVGRTASLFGLLLNNTGIRNGIPRKSDKPYHAGFVSGAAMFVRRDIFLALGGFDERFFLYFEDMDLCVRARTRGVSVVSVPLPVFRHTGGQSRESEESRKREFYASQDLYFGKHRPKWEMVVMRFLRRRFAA